MSLRILVVIIASAIFAVNIKSFVRTGGFFPAVPQDLLS